MTYEEVKEIRENPNASDCNNKELAEMIDAVIEKQIKKKGKNKNSFTDICVGCGNSIYPHMNYCSKCGQALDWGDNNGK